jgi:hypothetical protein
VLKVVHNSIISSFFVTEFGKASINSTYGGGSFDLGGYVFSVRREQVVANSSNVRPPDSKAQKVDNRVLFLIVRAVHL